MTRRGDIRTGLAGGLAAVLSIGISACDGPVDSDPGDNGRRNFAVGGCPSEITELVETGAATSEMDVAIDLSRSFVPDKKGLAKLQRQVDAMIDDAIEAGDALRIVGFTTSVSSAIDILACPSMAAAHNNDAALPRHQRTLRDRAHEAVDRAVAIAMHDLRDDGRMSGPGTSVVGGWVALVATPPLTNPEAHSHAVMLSDAIGMPGEDALAVDLSGFDAVSMYGIGQTDQQISTTDVVALTDAWTVWLAAHGAVAPTVSSSDYQ